jgi:hypothetical protein
MVEYTKKFYVVLFSILALIPVLLLLPNFPDSMPNRAGLILGIIPLALFSAMAAGSKSCTLPMFFSGFFLIFLGIGFLVLLGGFEGFAKILEASNTSSPQKIGYWRAGAELWIYAFPLVSTGLGINIVAAFISADPD